MLEKLGAVIGILTVAAILGLCITMPLSAFSIVDYNLLDGENVEEVAYINTELQARDFVFLKSMTATCQNNNVNNQTKGGSFGVSNSEEAMIFNGNVIEQVQKYLQQLTVAGVVPDIVLNDYEFMVSTAGRTGNENGVLNGYYSNTSTGIVHLNVYFVQNGELIHNSLLLCSLSVDVKSDMVLSMFYLSDTKFNNVLLDVANENYIKYAGLDITNDWEQINELGFADQCIYSPSLNLVSMLETGEKYKTDNEKEKNWFSLKLMLVDEQQISLRKEYAEKLTQNIEVTAENTQNLQFVCGGMETVAALGEKFYLLQRTADNMELSYTDSTTLKKNTIRFLDSEQGEKAGAPTLQDFSNAKYMLLSAQNKIFIVLIKEETDLSSTANNLYNKVQIIMYDPKTNESETVYSESVNSIESVLAYDDNAVYLQSESWTISEKYYDIIRVPFNKSEQTISITLTPGEEVTGTYGQYFITQRKMGVQGSETDGISRKEYVQIQKDNVFALLDFSTQTRIKVNAPSFSKNVVGRWYYILDGNCFVIKEPNAPAIPITKDGIPFKIDEKYVLPYAVNMEYFERVFLSNRFVSYIINPNTDEAEEYSVLDFGLVSCFGDTALVYDAKSSRFGIMSLTEYYLASKKYTPVSGY